MIYAAIAVTAAVTILIRFLPFWLFSGKGEVPAPLVRLGAVLPPAIMAVLVVYCLKDMPLLSNSHALPEILGVLVTSASYVWKRNTLLSIAAGTLLYMVLVQTVF